MNYQQLMAASVMLISAKALASDGVIEVPSQAVRAAVPFEQVDWAVMPTPLETVNIASIERDVPMGQTDEELITYLMVNQQWDELAKALVAYQQKSNHDPVLYDYAMGAMLRSQAKHNQAIKHYEKITQDPALIFPKFDLAVMYFENKQYRDAKRAFEAIKPSLPAPMQAISEQYLSAIKKIERAKPSFGLNIEQNDNVNNASSLREFDIGGMTFIFDEESQPKSATGLRYNIGIDDEHNVTGRHHLYASAGMDGIYYPSERDYDELSLRGELGYRYKTIKSTVGITPFIAQDWLGGDQYQQQWGIGASATHRMSANWQLTVNATHSQKRYDDHDISKRYDGHANEGLVMALYQPTDQWLYYVGMEARHERLQDVSESSNRQGLRLGMGYYGKDMGVRAMLRHAKREFLAPNFWYGKVRHDTESQFIGTVWHNKLNYKGFVPKLNYRHQHTDSNLDLYDRRSGAWFVTVDKMF
ncbi:surface lipoprotein assembly modifier [uncultured Moraxella sp.]|uniref:surface lipoprotein assembly modifier n=1 Tax=uncultured Moraxella sp. TaxID=263769 RepID=UPI0025CD654A|nr:surface lipoprotein assembly modifier [uncultured Moraxella sp.]